MEQPIMDFNSSKVKVPCSWCGKIIERYRSQLRVSKHSYCCSACRSASISKRTNPNGYTRHAHLSEYNRENNGSRMTPQVRDKLRKSRLGKGGAKVISQDIREARPPTSSRKDVRQSPTSGRSCPPHRWGQAKFFSEQSTSIV